MVKQSRYLEVRLDGASLYRSERRVLTRIDWTIRPAERWVLLGANGSGKTQLLKLIAGIVRLPPASPPTLRYRLGGEWHRVPYEVKERIAYVGPERQDKYQRYEWNMSAGDVVGTGVHSSDIPLIALSLAERRRVRATLGTLRIAHLAARPFLELSHGERRIVLLARALASRPALLLLDEVFTGLDAANRDRVSRWLASQRGRLPWVLATHRSEDVPVSATHALILHKGRVLHAGGLQHGMIVRHLGLRRSSKHPIRKGDTPRASIGHRVRRRKSGPAPTVVQLRNAQVFVEKRRVLRDINLTVRAGEFWVIHGANGVGKTTLLRTLYGDYGVAVGGTVVRAGIKPGIPLDQFRRRTGILGPHLQARYPRSFTVTQVVQSGRHASIGLHRRATQPDRAAARRTLQLLGLSKLARRKLGELSYGKARLVLLARALVCDPKLLLLDEPLDTIDGPTRRKLTNLIVTLPARGVAVVVTAHSPSNWSASATHEIELTPGGALYCGPMRRF
jgi:molybdate transport system ATP-binding protein